MALPTQWGFAEESAAAHGKTVDRRNWRVLMSWHIAETRERARALFARVLDCPGGGLRIDTIHAFDQYLLAAFPTEAQILPAGPVGGFKGELVRHDPVVVIDVRLVLAEALRNGERATTFSNRSNIRPLCTQPIPDWMSLRRWPG